MTLSLRLQRHGKKSRPFYHIIAADVRSPRDGKFKEKIGYYDSNREPSVIKINAERLQFYFSNGARISNVVRNLAKIKNIPLQRGTKKQPPPPSNSEEKTAAQQDSGS